MKTNYLIILLTSCFLGMSCQKYLAAKTDKNLVVPATVSDLQAVLSNANDLNTTTPVTGEIASDNVLLTDELWSTRSVTDRNAYLWQEDVFNDNDINDWSNAYIVVNYANVVLDQLDEDKIQGDAAEKNNVKGEALFFRSYAFLNLLQIFAPAYDSTSSETELGIPLRLHSDLNIPSMRSNVESCYNQVIKDTKTAISLLGNNQAFLTLPSKIAGYALLSRCYLMMGKYYFSNLYADSALQLKSDLMEFSVMDPHSNYPFKIFNSEIIFHTYMFVSGTLSNSVARVDSVLYNDYQEGDLRKQLFFSVNPDGSHGFKGSYNGNLACFSGLATDELYLNQAESLCHMGKKEASKETLQYLLSKRYTNSNNGNSYNFDTTHLLSSILRERRKELLFRGIRWGDLKRLNRDKETAIVIQKKIYSTIYTLEPQSLDYIMPIPWKVIDLTGMEQNKR